jgi:hypothetical protein
MHIAGDEARMISDRTIVSALRFALLGYFIAMGAGLIWLAVWLLERLR